MNNIVISVFLAVLLASCSTSVRFSSENTETTQIKKGRSQQISIEKGTVHGVYEKLLTEAERWIGVPYKWGGQSMDGVDCSAFVGNVYKAVGISLPRTSTQQYESISKKVDNPKVGDLVFFTFTSSPISHVGMYVGNNKFIHASTSRGVIVQNLEDKPYSQKLVGIKRVID